MVVVVVVVVVALIGLIIRHPDAVIASSTLLSLEVVLDSLLGSKQLSLPIGK